MCAGAVRVPRTGHALGEVPEGVLEAVGCAAAPEKYKSATTASVAPVGLRIQFLDAEYIAMGLQKRRKLVSVAKVKPVLLYN